MDDESVAFSPKELRRLQCMQSLAAGPLTQAQAALTLNTSERHVRRLFKRFREQGPAGVISGHRGKPSPNRFADALRAKALDLIRARYCDFGPTFAAEKLREQHGVNMSTESVRQLMIGAQLWQRKTRKRRAHPSRQRRPRFGELIQIDGSPHDWFEDRGPRCTLIVFIDDATSKLLGLRFAPAETTWAYFDVARATIERFGRPLAYYSDKHGIFRINDSKTETQERYTQFGRAMRQLDIELICANSPQAKGRVERANRTLQNRLLKELRLRGISNIQDANAFLAEFTADYNRRFSVEPRTPEDAHRPCEGIDLEHVFSIHTAHRVSKNLIVQHENARYHITQPNRARRLQHAEVTACTNRAGNVTLRHQGNMLQFERLPDIERNGQVADRKAVAAHLDAVTRKSHKPAANHPWSHYQRQPGASATETGQFN